MIAKIYKRLLQIGKVAGTLTFLLGIPYGIWQYIEAKHDKRIEQSLRLFEKFNSSPFTDYRIKINEAVATNRAKLVDAVMDPKIYETTVLELVEQNGIESSLWLVLDFFDGVTICVTSKICDAQTVGQLFTERAKELFLTFYQYILARRNSSASATFGYGLEFIATNGKSQAK
jgi:hypothetical protein